MIWNNMSDIFKQLDNLIASLEAQPIKSNAMMDSLEELKLIKQISKVNPDKMYDDTLKIIMKDAMEDAVQANVLGLFLDSFNIK